MLTKIALNTRIWTVVLILGILLTYLCLPRKVELSGRPPITCSPTATTNCPVTPWPTLPIGGGKFIDPDYGTTIMRLTDASDGASPAGCRPAYSYWPTLNYNNTRALALCGPGGSPVFYGINQPEFTRGAKRVPTTTLLDYLNGSYWDDADADLTYALGSVSTILYQYNVATDVPTVKKDFSSYLPADRYLFQLVMSDDRNIMAAAIRKASDFSYLGVFVYNLQTDTVLKNDETIGTAMNEAHLSGDGRFLSLDLDNPQRYLVYDLQSGGSGTLMLFSQDGPSHNTMTNADLVSVTFYSTNTFVKWPLVAFTPANKVNLGIANLNWTVTGPIHLSCLALDKNFCLASLSDAAPIVSLPFHNEVFLFSTNGNGTVRRFVHHHAIYTGYESSPFGNISSDGAFASFGSNNDNSGRNDVFIASVNGVPVPSPTPTPTATPTPTPTPPDVCKPNQLLSSGCTCTVPPRKITGPVSARRCK